MKLRPLTFALFAVLAGTAARAAEEPETKPTPRELLRAKIAEDAKKKSTLPVAKSAAPTPAATTAAPTPAAATPPSASAKTETAKAAKQTPTVLPKVEVRKERITVLDVEIAKQEEAIARERKNLKPSETDLALNDSAIAKPLAIFGGESAQFRKRVASERVELMEAEKDILEAMKRARTKEEKAGLQKQVDELRAVRRELEKTLR